MSVPTLILYVDGAVTVLINGFRPLTELRRQIEPYLT